ncbi:MAG: MBL fold metallo-hydrolase, partial [Gemmatimonadetes bacterium]|nr:MBL fold metallo-hydrolase [Gemmatimonadota bacterium]
GTAMGRRATYQFGSALPLSPTGRVSAGLGTGVARGSFGILAPTVLVTEPTQELVLDGVRFVFHNRPGAEAPAELTFELPDLKVLDAAELVQQTMHNLLPIRGAKVRDARRWAGYLEAMRAEGARADVMIAQHGWPTWGAARIDALISAHRDAYQYTHDQSVRLLNAGRTPAEIAEEISFPPGIGAVPGSRGYYGALRHNAKAVYQFYLGAYDGNPAHLDPLPPEESAKRRVALMGGAGAVRDAAQKAFAAGDYRWAAELLNELVFSGSTDAASRGLLARTYEQLGYQAESATWRNAYLAGAAELRGGAPTAGIDRARSMALLTATPVERFLDAMAASVDGPAAARLSLVINLVLSDTRESHVLTLSNGVLRHRPAPPVANANATLTVTHGFFVRMMAGSAGAKDLLLSPEAHVSGNRLDLARFFGVLTKAAGTFGIVEP